MLRDLIGAGTLPMVRLTKIFRQAQQSGIVGGAHRINAGQPAGTALRRASVQGRDKVTQLRNNYEKGAAGVFNGTAGVVTRISLKDHSLTVLTDEDQQADYGFDELDELAHAYAVTIHRSQGSEYPAAVIPLTMGS